MGEEQVRKKRPSSSHPDQEGREAQTTSLSQASQDCSPHGSQCDRVSLSSARSPAQLLRSSYLNLTYILHHTFIFSGDALFTRKRPHLTA